MDKRLERILPRVQKPARYVGGEYNAVKKDPAQVDTRIAFCFPDTYEIGMSNLGMRILYGVMNNMDGVWCERVFAPWGDMEEEMRRAGMPLYCSGEPESLSRTLTSMAFSVGYEMAYHQRARICWIWRVIPMRSGGAAPACLRMVVAGGTCACITPSLMAAFVDSVRLGEGEDVHRGAAWSCTARPAGRAGARRQFLRAAAQLPGIYVPCLYEVTYHDDGTVAEITPLEGAPTVVTKRIVHDYGQVLLPTQDHRPLHGDRAGSGDAGAVPGLHPGLPVLSGGVCLPPGPRPQRGP